MLFLSPFQKRSRAFWLLEAPSASCNRKASVTYWVYINCFAASRVVLLNSTQDQNLRIGISIKELFSNSSRHSQSNMSVWYLLRWSPITLHGLLISLAYRHTIQTFFTYHPPLIRHFAQKITLVRHRLKKPCIQRICGIWKFIAVIYPCITVGFDRYVTRIKRLRVRLIRPWLLYHSTFAKLTLRSFTIPQLARVS